MTAVLLSSRSCSCLARTLPRTTGLTGLEMRRIGRQRQVNHVVVELAIGRGAKVILDIAGSVDFVRLEIAALELVEDGLERLAHHVGEHVQASAMGHADDDVAHAESAAALDDLLHRRNQGFPAVEAETLGAGVLDVKEFLEFFRMHQLVEDRLASALGEGDLLAEALDPFLQPCRLGRVRYVHVLKREGPAVGPSHDAHDLAKGCGLEPEHIVEEDRPGPCRIR